MDVLTAVAGNLRAIFHSASLHISMNSLEGLPVRFLIYQVTVKCNSRCKMCSIWKMKRENELSCDEIDDMLEDDYLSTIRWINITGGEPFLRDDLPEIIRIFMRRCRELELIAVPTNGFLPNRIVETVDEILKILDGKILLNVNVSIDHIGEKHDEIRGIRGGFKRAMETLKLLKEKSEKNKKFECGVETVMMDYNSADIFKIYSYLKKKTEHVNMTPAITSSYYGLEDGERFISDDTVKKILDFIPEYIKNEPAYAYYMDKVVKIYVLKNLKNRPFPCLGGYTTAYLDSAGNVYPCLMLPIEEFYLGNVREKKFGELWSGENAKKMRRNLKDNKYCIRCTNNCDIISNFKLEFIDPLIFYFTHPSILWNFMHSLKRGKMMKYI